MIVDTSAIVAILRGESDSSAMAAALVVGGDKVSLSAGSWIELAAVITRSGQHHLWADAEDLIETAPISIAPVTIEQAEIAREAYRRYGLGTGHPAKLNFGDCFAYALAKATGEPLLFKGADFAHTDVARALPA
ncbi:type II toxin-antitoxin system VapC family toxin [Sphingomonas gilva]|uniref:Ribonuclease VapC n=1 Tax=Sphingomonas gilva TaxID=2305907 RepID=A0A396RNI6_9SPHN|nr:type II toxin-antitoxin system VapC family toxin [Sphingomonas gilva]RHW18067.1 type II toxin-antitoxin system VapC family toxin [Sphingomonas gilva]